MSNNTGYLANAQVADYKEQQVIDYQGNPLIEALPMILSPDDAYDALYNNSLINFSVDERSLPTHIRYHSIARLTRFFQPVMQHIDLEQRISRLIRQGYISRNPNSPVFKNSLASAHNVLQNNIVKANAWSTASSFTLMGFSGIGKTTAIEKVLDLYPNLILHEHPLHLTQVVWLKLNCPHDGSLKSLCMDFFIKMDDLLGTNYFERFGSMRNSVSSMVTRMGQIARLHCIGTLIIDEIQHLLSTRDNNSEKMMNFFVTLVNEIGVPVIMIGTMRAKSVLQKDFRQARRGSGQGDMVWQQMPKDGDWDHLIESMWEYQWLKHEIPLTEELNQVLYDESQGIIDIAVKIFALSQGRAIETGREKLEPNLLRLVAKEDLKLVQPMLKALRNGQISELEKYQDIMPMDIETHLQRNQSKINLQATRLKQKEALEKKRKDFETSSLEKLIMTLIDLNVNEKVAAKAANNAIKELGNVAHTKLLQKALMFIEELETKPQRREKQMKLNVLSDIIQKGKVEKQSAYESLYKAKYIKVPLNDFAI